MNLNTELLAAMGVPENLLTAAMEKPDPRLKKSLKKLDINFSSASERALWDILCFLEGDRPTVRARKLLRLDMRRMAVAQDAILGGLQALITGADSGPAGRSGKGAKGVACHASAASQKSRSPSR